MNRFLFLLTAILGAAINVFAQNFTKADTLRGTLSDQRSCFDVTYYNLIVEVDIDEKSIKGVNHIHFTTITEFERLQLDLFANMLVDSIFFEDSLLNFTREFDAVHVEMGRVLKKGETGEIEFYYHGIPTIAKRAPWDGGFVWKEDFNGKPFIGVACEGDGASLWWPNKDHLSDEPDSMRIAITVPDSLMAVSNGNLERVDSLPGKLSYQWLIQNPINNYNVTLNVADYAHFDSLFVSATNDSLRLDYYVLKENLEKAKIHFRQVPEMMTCYETAFGPYPFYEDGYALVETSYAGMEHQSAIAYGNNYMKGYGGRFPADMDFDYIIIHETGHEWWGNSVSANDLADMWIHESFCTYSEAVFVECKYGYQKMLDYLFYQKNFINNQSPVQGPYGVNKEGNGTDMYYKGAWMIHTLRNVLQNDQLFRSLLREMALSFRHTNIDAEDVFEFWNSRTDIDLTGFFAQYLTRAELPTLEYHIKKRKFFYRWNAVEGFDMPLDIAMGEITKMRINPSANWATIEFKKKMLRQLEFRKDLFLFDAKKVDKPK